MKRWLLPLLLLLPAHLPAQTRAADSLRTLLRADARPDTTRARRLQALGLALQLSDLPRATEAMKQALALSRQLHDPAGEGTALLRLSGFCRRGADFGQARRYLREASTLFERRHDLAGLGKAYLQLSFIEAQQQNPAASLQAALQGLPYADKAGDRVNQTRLQVAIGNVYVQLENPKDALAVLLPALRNARALNDSYMVAAALNLLGNAYRMQQDWPRAVGYFRQAGRLNRQLGDEESALVDEINLAELYVRQGRLPEALRHAARARAAARATHDAYNLPAAELAVARVYLLQNRPDSAVALARHALVLGQASRVNESLRNASDILAQAYARLGHYAEAYQYKTRWAAYNDSIVGEEAQRKTAALRYGYELDKKQTQIALLKQGRALQAQRAARQRQEMRGLSAGLLGLLLWAGLLVRNIFLKQRANRALNEKNEHIALQRDHLDQALSTLKATQGQLVQSEKMVALAALTAGVAHEIQNPLNFVNNFSEVSLELMTELEEERQQPAPDAALVAELLHDLQQNLHKIHEHGARAAGIVKSMLHHAHPDPGQRQAVDLNAQVQDYLRLAYHTLQNKHRDFVANPILDLDPALGPVCMVPQELGRVLLNLFTNAFYAVHQKTLARGPGYEPAVRVSTRRLSGGVELRVHDNGPGIPAAIIEKVFEPFFTTKPPGEGTGLGLWLSYDIVTKGYGGTLRARSEEGVFTEMVLTLPPEVAVPVAAPVLAAAADDE